MPILNYTTSINADRTVAEVQKLLARAGARRMMIDYDAKSRPVALAYQFPVGATVMHYRLPCRHEGVLKRLKADRVASRYQTEQHALNVSWRILRDWLEAQLAIVQAGLADMSEVMLPYALVDDGVTVYERWQAQYLLEDTGEKSNG